MPISVLISRGRTRIPEYLFLLYFPLPLHFGIVIPRPGFPIRLLLFRWIYQLSRHNSQQIVRKQSKQLQAVFMLKKILMMMNGNKTDINTFSNKLILCSVSLDCITCYYSRHVFLQINKYVLQLLLTAPEKLPLYLLDGCGGGEVCISTVHVQISCMVIILCCSHLHVLHIVSSPASPIFI